MELKMRSWTTERSPYAAHLGPAGDASFHWLVGLNCSGQEEEDDDMISDGHFGTADDSSSATNLFVFLEAWRVASDCTKHRAIA